MGVILLPKYYDQKVALRPESYKVFNTKVCRRIEAWQWMSPPKSWNTKICKRKTFMISHIFFGIKASPLVLNRTPSIFLLLLMYFFHIYDSLYSHDNSLGIRYFLPTCQYKRKWFECVSAFNVLWLLQWAGYVHVTVRINFLQVTYRLFQDMKTLTSHIYIGHESQLLLRVIWKLFFKNYFRTHYLENPYY